MGVASAASKADMTSAIGEVAISAASAIYGISDAKKRAQYEQNLALLNAEQQKALNDKVVAASSESERLKILSDYLSTINKNRIANLSTFYVEQEKKKRNEQIIYASILLLVGAGIVYVIVKKA